MLLPGSCVVPNVQNRLTLMLPTGERGIGTLEELLPSNVSGS